MLAFLLGFLAVDLNFFLDLGWDEVSESEPDDEPDDELELEPLLLLEELLDEGLGNRRERFLGFERLERGLGE